MDVAALKLDLIQWLAQIQDESLLKKIQLIKKIPKHLYLRISKS